MTETALIAAHRDLAEKIANGFFIPGGDRDDVRQEALIGLMVAARSYDGRIPFRPFAALVVRRRLVSKVREATAEKHMLLNDRADLTERGTEDTAVLVERRDTLRRIVDAYRLLTPLERRWLVHAVNGGTSGGRVGRDRVADNAVQRARRKLREAA